MEVKAVLHDAIRSLYEESKVPDMFQQYHNYLMGEYYLTLDDLFENLSSTNLPGELKKKISSLIKERHQSETSIDLKIKRCLNKVSNASTVRRNYIVSNSLNDGADVGSHSSSSIFPKDINDNQRRQCNETETETETESIIDISNFDDINKSAVLTDFLNLDVDEYNDDINSSNSSDGSNDEINCTRLSQALEESEDVRSTELNIGSDNARDNNVQAAIVAAWAVYLSDDGYPYHFNSITNESSWDCPLGLYVDRNVESREIRENEDEYYRECECISGLFSVMEQEPFIYTNKRREDEEYYELENDERSANTLDWNDIPDDATSISTDSKTYDKYIVTAEPNKTNENSNYIGCLANGSTSKVSEKSQDFKSVENSFSENNKCDCSKDDNCMEANSKEQSIEKCNTSTQGDNLSAQLRNETLKRELQSPVSSTDTNEFNVKYVDIDGGSSYNGLIADVDSKFVDSDNNDRISEEGFENEAEDNKLILHDPKDNALEERRFSDSPLPLTLDTAVSNLIDVKSIRANGDISEDSEKNEMQGQTSEEDSNDGIDCGEEKVKDESRSGVGSLQRGSIPEAQHENDLISRPSNSDKVSPEMGDANSTKEMTESSDPSNWEVCFNNEDIPYHFNFVTGESVWNCPHGLFLHEVSTSKVGDFDDVYRECECIRLAKLSRNIKSDEANLSSSSELSHEDVIIRDTARSWCTEEPGYLSSDVHNDELKSSTRPDDEIDGPVEPRLCEPTGGSSAAVTERPPQNEGQSIDPSSGAKSSKWKKLKKLFFDAKQPDKPRDKYQE